MDMGELTPHWMDEIIAACRSKQVLRNREISLIRNGIASHKEGARLGNHPDIRNAIEAGLEAARARQRELKNNPALAGAGPNETARMVILDRLGEVAG